MAVTESGKQKTVEIVCEIESRQSVLPLRAHMKKLFALLVSLFWIGNAFAQSPTPTPDAEFHIWADDSFEVFVNGTSTWKGDDYTNTLKKTVPLRGGDVVIVTVTDKQGGAGGGFAAILLRGKAVVATTKDFRYSVNPSRDFTTNASTQGLRSPDLEPLQRSFGLGPDLQPKKAWTQKSDREYGVVHFKFVVPR